MKTRHFLLLFVSLLFTLFLAACATSLPSSSNLDDLVKLTPKQVDQTRGIGGIRLTALRDTALSVGARGGLSWRAKQLNKMLDRNAHRLDRIFNFHAMMLENNVLPPVLVEGRTTLNLPAEDTIRLADRAYQIKVQAKFVTLPPTWRDYLWLKFKEPELPHRTLLPRDEDEKKIWKTYIRQGWVAGIEQANNIYTENLGRLKRDYNGMILYRSLLAQHIVSPPYVARTDLGVTGNSSELNVNDRILRITALPSLVANSSDWKTEITPHD